MRGSCVAPGMFPYRVDAEDRLAPIPIERAIEGEEVDRSARLHGDGVAAGEGQPLGGRRRAQIAARDVPRDDGRMALPRPLPHDITPAVRRLRDCLRGGRATEK